MIVYCRVTLKLHHHFPVVVHYLYEMMIGDCSLVHCKTDRQTQNIILCALNFGFNLTNYDCYVYYVDVIIISENGSLTPCRCIHHPNHYLLHQAVAGSKVGG